MGNIGYFALLVAFLSALYSAVAFIFGVRLNSSRLLASARNGLFAFASLVTFAAILLLYAIFAHDFSLQYVIDYTSRGTSPIYLLSALWAGNSGAILLWAWILSILAVIVFLRKNRSQKTLIPYVGLVLVVMEAFFVLLLLVLANPFAASTQTVSDGFGLNLLLHNAGMVLHPPALILGYAAFTIPFAFAISALLNGKTDDDWIVTSRRWFLLAWLFLGLGNIIGAWWAYVELSFGGYWAWDPVENASLMPWLMATAFLHSSIMQRRNGQFKVWSMVLVVLTFCLVLFGAFLNRAEIPGGSAHSFPDTVQMATYFLVFGLAILVVSLGLIVYRRKGLSSAAIQQPVNREATFLLNNILLVAVVAITFVMTIFPWISSATGNAGKIGAASFSRIDGTIFLLIILLIGVCTVIGWKRDTLRRLARKMLWPFVGALIVAGLSSLVARQHPVAIIAFFILGFVISNIVLDWLSAARARARARGENFFSAGWHLPWANSQHYGGYLVHISIVVIALGIVGSSLFQTEMKTTLKVGDSVKVNQYTFTYTGITVGSTSDGQSFNAGMSISNSASPIGTITPQILYQFSRQESAPKVALRSNPVEDIYVTMDDFSDTAKTADFTILINPLVEWIWIGGGVFLLGGLITFWPSRRPDWSVSPSASGSTGDSE